MKIAFYMEDGLEQIVLTPESKFEHSMLEKLHNGSRSFDIKRGSFYECRGGYVRGAFTPPYESGDASTMIVLRQIGSESPTPQSDVSEETEQNQS